MLFNILLNFLMWSHRVHFGDYWLVLRDGRIYTEVLLCCQSLFTIYPFKTCGGIHKQVASWCYSLRPRSTVDWVAKKSHGIRSNLRLCLELCSGLWRWIRVLLVSFILSRIVNTSRFVYSILDQFIVFHKMRLEQIYVWKGVFLSSK